MRESHLCTERLSFSHWRKDDLPLAKKLWGNGQVSRYITSAGEFTEDEIAARLAREIENALKHSVQYWPVFIRDSGEFIGCCGLRPYDADAGIFEFGVHLLPGYWGAGYASEAGRAVLAYAFGPLECKGVFAGHHPENTASRGMLLGLGFRYLRDEYYAPTGLNHPSYLLEAENGKNLH